jgi:Protein of unknown function (DUF3106)
LAAFLSKALTRLFKFADEHMAMYSKRLRELSPSWGSARSRALWVVGLASAAAFGFVRFTTLVDVDPHVQSLSTPAVRAMAPETVSVPAPDGAPDGLKAQDPLWAVLTASQRQALSPLEPIWPTMQESARSRWLAIAGRFQSESPANQARMHARMVEWTRLSPQQRTEARLRYLQTAKIDARLKRERWEAYNKKEETRRERVATSQMTVIPPVSVNAGTGATTVFLPQLARSTGESMLVDPSAPLGEQRH